MDRRGYLARIGAASAGGFALLAGCSGNGSDGSGESSESGGTAGGEAEGDDTEASGEDGEGGSDAATPTESGEILTTEDEALDTGQAPPSVTATQYENTATVPESQGLETGQAPDASQNNTDN